MSRDDVLDAILQVLHKRLEVVDQQLRLHPRKTCCFLGTRGISYLGRSQPRNILWCINMMTPRNPQNFLMDDERRLDQR